MFEVGDNIVFVNNTSCLNIGHDYKVRTVVIVNLKLYNIYKVIHISGNWIVLDETPGGPYEKSRFISISEYRRLKIKEICSKLKIK